MWFKWLLIGAFVGGAAIRVAKTGKPVVYTPIESALTVIETAFWIAGILYFWR